MATVQLIVTNATIYFPETDLRISGTITVEDGRISSIRQGPAAPEELAQAQQVLDAGGKLLIPGGIDPHVHLRDPGNPERETFATGTMAAAAGGVTTLMEHPISKPPQYSVKILENRIRVADAQAFVDYAFVGAAGGRQPERIQALARDGRVLAFKTFLHQPPNGRDLEFEGLTMADDYELYRGLEAVAGTGLHCLVHAEDNDLIQGLTAQFQAQGKRDPLAHTQTRPTIAEVASVARVITFARETGAVVEFCHISTPEAAQLIKEEKARGTKLILETCPHYLMLSTRDLVQHGPFAKCNPPLRTPEARDRLWDYVQDGTVDIIGSDHAPFLLEEKLKGEADIFQAMSGFPGIDLRMPLMMTAVKQGKLTLKRCVELLSVNPAKVFGIYPRKGTIQVGCDADFTVLDPDRPFVVDRGAMYTKSKETARVYEGWTLYGQAIHTVVRGRVVMRDGVVDPACQGWGELITRLEGAP